MEVKRNIRIKTIATALLILTMAQVHKFSNEMNGSLNFVTTNSPNEESPTQDNSETNPEQDPNETEIPDQIEPETQNNSDTNLSNKNDTSGVETSQTQTINTEDEETKQDKSLPTDNSEMEKDLFFWKESLKIELRDRVPEVCGVSFSGPVMIDEHRLISPERQIDGLYGSWDFFENEDDVVFDGSSNRRHLLIFEIDRQVDVLSNNDNIYNQNQLLNHPMRQKAGQKISTDQGVKETGLALKEEEPILTKENGDNVQNESRDLGSKDLDIFDNQVSTEFYDRFYYLPETEGLNGFPLSFVFEVMVLERNETASEELFCPILLKGEDDFQNKTFDRAPGKLSLSMYK